MPKATVYMKHVTLGRSKIEYEATGFRVHAENGVTQLYDPQSKLLFAAPSENLNHIEIEHGAS
jgi:hypothetical protein